MPVESYPLTFPQEAIFLDALLHDPTTKFNMGGAIAIRGPLEAALFERALGFARQHHDVYRLRVHGDGDEVRQEFVADAAGRFEALDYSGRVEPFQSAMEWVHADFERPMRTDAYPLSADVLFRLGADRHLWYPTFHHIANDAYGHAVVAGTVATAYTQLLAHGTLPDLERHSYVDFIRDDRAYARSARYRDDGAFWRDRFASMPDALPFTIRKGTQPGSLRTERRTLAVSRAVYTALQARCDDAGATPFQFLVAALVACLHRSTGRDDIVVGTPILNRKNRAFRRTAGMCMNMMPLRVGVAERTTVLGLARQIGRDVTACYRHQRFPIGEIVRHCRTLDGFCDGVYDVTLVYRKLDYDLAFGDATATTVTLDTQARAETLSVEVDDYNAAEGVTIFFNFNRRGMMADEAERMAAAFEALLTRVAIDGDTPVNGGEHPGSRPLDCRHPAGSEETVLDLFARRARETPGGIAVVDGATRVRYDELTELSDRVAGALRREFHLSREQPVAVSCERTTQWIAALIGVMKAGGAYLPLDPDLPRERLAFMLRDTGCEVLLAGDTVDAQAFPGVRTVRIEDALNAPAEAPAHLASAGDLAYVVYSSGTTGPPKGILVEHAGLANTASEQARGWDLKPADGILQFAAPGVDASLAEVFASLVSGARLVIAPKATILDPSAFVEFLSSEEVTVAILPPVYLSALGGVALPSLRLLGTAGDVANPVDVARYNRTATYVNAYGPAETSICATFLKLEAGEGFTTARVPIGTALRHCDVHIVDARLQPVPDGAAGEICVGGVNVARGYLNQPELTRERFLASPFREGDRLYRTGDLGRRLADGRIEFLGRRDTQVKVRGYRVELGEIEALLKTHPDVETATVLADPEGNLVAFVVPRQAFSDADLRRFLGVSLPAYMVPVRWVSLPALPVNPAGKVDRCALSFPLHAPAPTAAAAVPRTATERSIAAIWESVLRAGPVPTTSNFFEIGGHSLSAVAILSRIRRDLGARVELRELFAAPTVVGLAAIVDRRWPSTEAPIAPVPPMESYPLSHAQARLWLLSQLEGGSAAYNMPIAFDLPGPIDVAALERAFGDVVARHETLRTRIVIRGGQPRQQVVPEAAIEIRLGHEDLRAAASPSDEAERRLRVEAATPFDLARAPLVRASVFRLSDSHWIFSLVLHHIVGDARSIEILLEDLASCYDGRPLAPLSLQYKDYAAWMERHLCDDASDHDRAFWLATLGGPAPAVSVPSDYQRPSHLGFDGRIDRFPLPASSRSGLAAYCAAHGVSPYMLLLATVFGVLHRYTGAEDLVVGVPVTGRDRLDLDGQVGLFVNTLPLRVRVDDDVSLSTLVERVRTALLAAHEHRSYPFDRIVADLKLERRGDRNPLFDVMVVMQSAARMILRLGDVIGSGHIVPVNSSVFDLTCHFAQDGQDVHVALEYNTSLFAPARVARLAGHLDLLLAAMASSPERRVGEVELLDARERSRIVGVIADGPRVPRTEATAVDLFAAQAVRTPDRMAVRFEERTLTYRQLAAAAAGVADRVERRLGAGSGRVVALVAGRSEWIVAGVLGIMASGAACLPIDASLPLERMRHILDDSGCEAVVTDRAVDRETALPLVALRSAEPEKAPRFASRARSGDVAYVTFTSGSTGLPKGCLIEHASLANLVLALGEPIYDAFPTPAAELLLAPLGVDVAMKQIFGALAHGHAVVVAGDALRLDPRALMAAIVADRIALIDVTPSHAAALLAHGFARLPKPDLKAIIFGSEALPSNVLDAFGQEAVNDHLALFNFYGPSECSVEALFCRVDGGRRWGSGVVPIGRPLANARVYVLAPDLEPLPIGIPGEICLGGTPVGRGYLNRPALNAARFVSSPFHPGERIFRTGDLGRWGADGLVEIMGRQDRQVKVRGHRIEPGEVEHHVLCVPGVTGAVALGRLSPAGSTELVAWYTAGVNGPDAALVRGHLRGVLPREMMPAYILAVPVLPLHVSGKVNEDALPDPWTVRPSTDQPSRAEDAVDATVLGIWHDVLGARPGSLDEEFFDAGGNSLLLAGLHARLDARYPGALTLVELFSASTVREQGRLVRLRTRAGSREAPTAGIQHAATTHGAGLVSLAGSGPRTVFCFAPGSGSCLAYRDLAHRLSRWHVYGLDFVQTAQPASSMADSIEEAKPDVGYLLLGHSSGGNMAYETALVLAARGRSPGGLVLLDSWRRLGCARATDDEYEAGAAELMAALDRGVNAASVDRHPMLRRMVAFDRHLDGRAEEGRLPCPIRLVSAAPGTFYARVPLTQAGWSDLTDDFRVTAGSGRHLEMLNEPHVAVNAAIIDGVLQELEWGAHARPAMMDGPR